MTAAVFGVFFTFLDSFYSPLRNLLGPVFMSLTFGVYALSALFPLYLTRKPGAALIGSLFAALINILTGSPYGIHIIIAGGLQGVGAELGFGLGKYRSFSLLNFFIAAIFITAFVSARDYFVFGLGQLTMPLFLASIAVRIASASVISWLICLGLGTALSKTGLVRFSKSGGA
jgi:energy-coupling factor transport system substrate-specific component